MGITGHYGLPEAGYWRALESGVGFFFWEPPYHGMARFFRALPSETREGLTLVAGSMGQTRDELRADVALTARRLGLRRIPIFLLFWVRSQARLDEAREALEVLKGEGLIGAYGFSTHQRSLALHGLRAGWEVVMVRHNAAHRGIEAQVLPEALARGATLITFSNLCYTRMIKPPYPEWGPAPTAADNYRYSLGQPGVTACLSAPTTLEELDHNLTALKAAPMDADEVARMQRFGDEVYLHHKAFVRYIRKR